MGFMGRNNTIFFTSAVKADRLFYDCFPFSSLSPRKRTVLFTEGKKKKKTRKKKDPEETNHAVFTH